MIIDFSSRPPVPALNPAMPHLNNYRTVYAAQERAVRDDGHTTLMAYLQMYEDLDASYVVLKGRDLTSTFGVKVPNEAVRDFCRAHGPRYVGFAGVDPHRGKAAVEELEIGIREFGLKGLNIQCFEHQLTPNDRLLYPLYEKAVELGIPVNVHVGINFSTRSLMRYGQPMLLDEVLVDFPTLRVCASPPGWPWVNELIGLTWRHPNLWIGLVAVRPKLLATPHSGYEPLLQYGRTLLRDRIIFGSSFPMLSPKAAIAEIDALPLESAVRQAWVHDNALRFLGLPAPRNCVTIAS